MKRLIPIALTLSTLAIAAIVGWAVLSPRPACAQTGCIATFCGRSSECPGDCVCAIGMGKATGHCVGTR